MPQKWALLLFALVWVSVSAIAQTKTVTGTALDELGEPVIGANIIEVANPTNGVMSTIGGNFTIKVPENATLRATYIGYPVQEISVAGKTKVIINFTYTKTPEKQSTTQSQ